MLVKLKNYFEKFIEVKTRLLKQKSYFLSKKQTFLNESKNNNEMCGEKHFITGEKMQIEVHNMDMS